MRRGGWSIVVVDEDEGDGIEATGVNAPVSGCESY